MTFLISIQVKSMILQTLHPSTHLVCHIIFIDFDINTQFSYKHRTIKSDDSVVSDSDMASICLRLICSTPKLRIRIGLLQKYFRRIIRINIPAYNFNHNY